MDVPRPSELYRPSSDDERDAYYMAMALAQAAEAYEAGEVPVGCVIVLGDRVLAVARNRIEELEDPTAHAEMLAITMACGETGYARLEGAEVYCSLEPCFMCSGALSLARIARLCFAARDTKFGGCVSLAEIPTDERLNHRFPVREGPHAEEAAELLRSFFRERRARAKGGSDSAAAD